MSAMVIDESAFHALAQVVAGIHDERQHAHECQDHDSIDDRDSESDSQVAGVDNHRGCMMHPVELFSRITTVLVCAPKKQFLSMFGLSASPAFGIVRLGNPLKG